MRQFSIMVFGEWVFDTPAPSLKPPVQYSLWLLPDRITTAIGEWSNYYITTLNELTPMSAGDILLIPGIGKQSLTTIIAVLNKCGLSLRDEPLTR